MMENVVHVAMNMTHVSRQYNFVSYVCKHRQKHKEIMSVKESVYVIQILLHHKF